MIHKIRTLSAISTIVSQVFPTSLDQIYTSDFLSLEFYYKSVLKNTLLMIFFKSLPLLNFRMGNAEEFQVCQRKIRLQLFLPIKLG